MDTIFKQQHEIISIIVCHHDAFAWIPTLVGQLNSVCSPHADKKANVTGTSQTVNG